MRVGYLAGFAIFLGTISLAPSALLSAPITQVFPFAFRDYETFNTIGTGIGDNFSVGVSGVLPDGNAGTVGTGTNAAAGVTLPLLNLAFQGRPGAFGREFDYVTASSSNYLSPWTIVLQNGQDQLSVSTPDRTNTPRMEMVNNLAISGSVTAPTITWELPGSGPSVSRVRYELWNDDTNQIIGGQSPINLGAGAVDLSLSGLTQGVGYAVRITAEHFDSNGQLETRSSNWISWKADPASAAGNVAKLTTGSPVMLSQNVNVPTNPFNLVFDYKFLTPTGVLTVFLGGEQIGKTLTAPLNLESGFSRAFFEIDDNFLGLSNLALMFTLDGPAGSSLLLDNVSFPGLDGGDFTNLAAWTVGGDGTVEVSAVPLPGAGALFASVLIGLLTLVGVRSGRNPQRT